MSLNNVIHVSERIATNLVTRNTADELIDFVRAIPGKEVIIDFKNVEFASRSFAHEYSVKKRKVHKILIEKNMSSAVKKMFAIASDRKRTAVPVSISPSIKYMSFSSKSL
jgi:non-ribosomal peptide synthetase component E (peptide arylation enzyme)